MKRFIAIASFVVAAIAFFYLDSQEYLKVQLSETHTLLGFLAIACTVLVCNQVVTIIIVVIIQRYRGPEGEVKMLRSLLHMTTAILIAIAFLYCVGLLTKVGAVTAGFAGMLLGWSLQAPVSGVAAWLLVTLKRPFRIGDRVQFPSLALLGDVKQVGLMYTVLDQVGGAVGSEEAIGRGHRYGTDVSGSQEARRQLRSPAPAGTSPAACLRIPP